MLGQLLLAASRSTQLRKVITAAPVTSTVVDRFVAGESLDAAMAATKDLVGAGLRVTIDHLGEDVTDAAAAAATRDSYLRLLGRLDELGLGGGAEVSVKLSAFGQA